MKTLTAFGESMGQAGAEMLAGGEVAFFSAAHDPLYANEDAFGVFEVGPEHLVLAVADGVGGGPRGQDASRLAIEAVSGALAAGPDPAQLRPALLDAFETAQARILAQANGCATTLCVAEISGHCVRTYHCGDSGALLSGARRPAQVEDHIPLA